MMPHFGNGAYTLAEVARYTNVAPSTVRAWFRTRSDRRGRGPVFAGDFPPAGRDVAVSFSDLIDVLVAWQFRREGVKLDVIRRAHRMLKKEFGTPHPFCHQRLYTDGRDILVTSADSLGDETLSDVLSHQQFFVNFRECLTSIEYSEETMLAHRWFASTSVVLDPRIALGQPVISGTGTTVFVIARQFAANRDEALVPELYGVSRDAVRAAVEFEQTRNRRTAA